MRVGFISQWYPPETGSAALPGVMAQALQAAGHEVTVVTGLPNYPTGRLYPGYRHGRRQREEIAGIQVHRVPLFLSHDDNAVRRMTSYLSFAIAATPVAFQVFRHADAIWVHSTPATAALPALVTRALRGTPYVLHIQDLWPETVTASDMLKGRVESAAATALHRYCDLTYRRAARIGITAPGMRTALNVRGVPDTAVVDLPNWCDETVFQPMPRDEKLATRLGPFRPFTIMYAGAIGDVQGLDNVIEAASLLRSHSEIGFVLVGDGVARSRLQQRAEELGLDNVRFVPSQPLQDMARVLGLGDVQLISLRDIPLYRITLPSKVQATLATGRPMICAAGGNAATLVDQSGAGLSIKPESGRALADAALEVHGVGHSVRHAWGEAGRRYYERHLSQHQGVQTMSEMLRRALREERR